MKTKKKLVAILAMAMIVGFSVQTSLCYAATEGSSDVTVSYTPTEDSVMKFNMSVVIKGNGYLQDGDQKLTGSTTVFILKEGDQKTFLVKPDSGNYIESIVFDGKDITNQLKNGFITVTSQAYDTQLVVTFAKEATPNTPTVEPGKPTQPDNNRVTGSVNTGDASQTRFLVGGLMLSGLILFIALKKRKEENESENGGN